MFDDDFAKIVDIDGRQSLEPTTEEPVETEADEQLDEAA